MPFALVIAFAASLGIHLAALFGPDIELSTEPESMPLLAELRPLPPPLPMPTPMPPVEPVKKMEKSVPVKHRTPRPIAEAPASAPAVLSVPDAPSADAPRPPTVAAPELTPEPVLSPPEPELATIEPRLPPHGMIRYRVDRGDSNFEIGVSYNEWNIVDGHYRLVSVIETTGLVRLFKSYRIEMESRGQLTPTGLRPDYFVLRRNTEDIREKALFDWDAMKIRVGNQADQVLSPGAQDLLSFNYQLGYLPHPESVDVLPMTTGKKYGVYHLEVLGDEEIDVPAGHLRTLHLRAPGANTTELWLAYDYLLLPVKIRHVDSKGGTLVQVATEIQLGNK